MEKSEFTGSLLGLVLVSIASFLITVASFGILYPLAVCLKEEWYAQHTFIEGRQLEFTGNFVELFFQYIKWFLLTIITLGIYAFWLNIKMKQWVVRNIHFKQ